MGGRLSKRIDTTGEWRARCSDLEGKLGYRPGEIFEDWRATADLRQMHSVAIMPREVHEQMAFLDCLACLAKGGLTESVAN